MAIGGKKLYLGNEPMTLIQNNGFILVDPFSYTPAPVLDPDAEAFLTAAGITDPTITSSINTLVVDLKAEGIYSKMQALYPFVGGTSSTCKWNLINPVDSDAAYRMTFPNGGTFSSNGFNTNGTNQYGNTNMLGTAIGASAQNFHISIYAKDLTAEGGFDFGCRNNTQWLAGNMRNTANQYNARAFNNNISQSALDANTDTQGFYTISRQLTTSFIYGWNGSYLTGTESVTSAPAFNLVFGAYNDYGTIGLYQNRTYQTITVGNGMGTTELDAMQTILDDFQTNLGR